MDRRNAFLTLGLTIFTYVAPAAAAPAAKFIGVGVATNSRDCQSFATSENGSKVVGWCTVRGALGDRRDAFLWRRERGHSSIGVPPGKFDSKALGISGNGDWIVGSAKSTPDADLPSEAFIWRNQKFQLLGHVGGNSSEARAASADGTKVAGTDSIDPHGPAQAFIWDKKRGMRGLGDLPGGAFYSVATAISADGRTVVGFSESSSGQEAFKWTEAEGIVPLGTFATTNGVNRSSQAFDVSKDGSVIVGESVMGTDTTATVWTTGGGMMSLGEIPGGWDSAATAVSGDGRVIGGRVNTDSGTVAFIWDAENGVRVLRDVMIDDYGLAPQLGGWVLHLIIGLSQDGSVLTGLGRDLNNPIGGQGFVAILPPKKKR